MQLVHGLRRNGTQNSRSWGRWLESLQDSCKGSLKGQLCLARLESTASWKQTVNNMTSDQGTRTQNQSLSSDDSLSL